MTHALVTGGAGLIGSHLTDALLEKGYEVTILDNLDPQTHPFGKPDWLPVRARFIEGDTRDPQAWRTALDGIDVIFHQAAFGGFTSNYSHYLDANAMGTALMLEIIAEDRLPIRKIVAASSQAIYGEGSYECKEHGTQYPQPRSLHQLNAGEWELKCPVCGQFMEPTPIPEHKPYDGKTAYAISKYATERLILNLGKQLNIPSVALRYSVTFGPRQSIYNPYTGVVSIFSTRILNNLPPVIYEDGQQTRDFTYVGNIVSANLFCLENDACNWQAFNAGKGERVTVERLVRTLIELYGKSGLDFQCDGKQYRPGDARHMVPNPHSLESLGWSAAYSLEDGLRAYTEWITTQGDVKDYFSEAQERLKRLQVVRSRQIAG
jgi:dTDP-L-rhamnose 4-epimerase